MLRLNRTTNRYEAALRSSPPGGKVIGWPGAFPRAGATLNGLGDVTTDLLNAALPGASTVVATAQAQLAQLKLSLQMILGLSAVAALTGTMVLLRGK